jgi:hypothetical protein
MIFWAATLPNLKTTQHFWGTYLLHFGGRSKPNKKPERGRCRLLAEDMFLRNVGLFPHYVALQSANSTLHSDCCENPKSYSVGLFRLPDSTAYNSTEHEAGARLCNVGIIIKYGNVKLHLDGLQRELRGNSKP